MKTHYLTKKLGEIIQKILGGLVRAFVKHESITNIKIPLPEVNASIDLLIEQKVQEPLVKLPQTERTLDKRFLYTPIEGKDAGGNPLTPYTLDVSAIMDHLGTPLDPDFNSTRWYQDSNEVKAFNDEVGNFRKFKEEKNAGYSQESGKPFFSSREINYVGVSSQGGSKYLQYDGHSGYDFRYPTGTQILAPANGVLYKAADDFVNGKKGRSTAWDCWHTFYIDHQNGFSTWFLHCTHLHGDIESKIGNDYTKSSGVVCGQPVAYVGGFGYGEQNGMPVHLHFEVRNKDGEIVDPYRDMLWV